MTYENKLDFILEKISPFRSDNFKQKAEILPLLDNKIQPNELDTLLNKLYADANIDFELSYGYRINANGLILLDNKGYTQKKEREDELYKLALETKQISVKNTNWVIVSVLVAIILWLLGLLLAKC